VLTVFRVLSQLRTVKKATRFLSVSGTAGGQTESRNSWFRRWLATWRNPRRNLFRLLCLGGTLHFLASCNKPPATAKDFDGEYVYQYKTGQVEVLSLEGDSAYRQQLFHSVNDYRRGVMPSITHVNAWSSKGDSITLQKCFTFFDSKNTGTPLKAPIQESTMNVTWVPVRGNSEAALTIKSIPGHQFVRVDNRNTAFTTR
jgi:hypothetical protein